MVGVEVVGDDSGRSVTAVSGAECVVHIYVGVRSQSLGEVFLTFFHFLLGVSVGGIFLVDAHGLAFFLGIEAEVLEQESLAGLQSGSHVSGGSAVGSELYVGAESLGYGVLDLRERHLGVHFAFGLAHVAHDDERTAVSEDFLEGGESTADTGIVGDVAVLVQGHIEVNAYDGFVAVEVEIVDCHILNIEFCYWLCSIVSP